jgi:predicted DNA-binding protein
MSEDVKRLVEQIAAEAEATMNDPMPPGTVWARPNKLVTVATRVSPEHLAQIEALAEKTGAPVSALIRGWVIAGLNAHHDETVQHAIERLSADVQRLRELVA